MSFICTVTHVIFEETTNITEVQSFKNSEKNVQRPNRLTILVKVA